MSGRGSVIVVEQHLVKSRAWLSLTGAAPHIYLLFRTKCRMARRQGKPGKRGPVIANNGEIEFTYIEADKRYAIKKDRFARALDQLIDRGFIEVATTGMGVCKVKTRYAISERWRDFGTTDFKAATRPTPSIANPGFKPDNTLWQRACRKNSSAENAHGAVRENAHGGILAMRTNAHGRKVAILYKFRNNRWLASEIA